ncbi:MAG: AAA family ATPase, partial [Acutalibacteraceae bacterium]
MKTKYITIEREYGSGGAIIGHRLAEETGVPCYGREILEAVSKRYNVAVNNIESYEETVTNSFLYTIYAISQASHGNGDLLSKEGHIFVAEQAEIKKMAENGSGIFLGHCASEALKGKEGVVKVFVRCSNIDEKNERIVKEYGISKSEAEKTRKRYDKKRSN